MEATQSEHLHFAWKGEAEGKPEVDVKLRMEILKHDNQFMRCTAIDRITAPSDKRASFRTSADASEARAVSSSFLT